MRIIDLLQHLYQLYPLTTQETWDNSGLQVGDPGERLKGVLIALDPLPAVVAEAIELGCNLLLVHHPLIFRPLKQIDETSLEGRLLAEIVRHRLTVVSLHTCLDRRAGLRLGCALDLGQLEVLEPAGDEDGYGAVGMLSEPMSVQNLLHKVCAVFGASHLRYCGDPQRMLRRVGLMNGSGGSMVAEHIERLKLDALISGDVGYHAMNVAAAKGSVLIDAGHFWTERLLRDFLSVDVADCLTKESAGADCGVYLSRVEHDPFQLFVAGAADL